MKEEYSQYQQERHRSEQMLAAELVRRVMQSHNTPLKTHNQSEIAESKL